MWSLAQVEVVLGGRLLACQFDIDRGLAQPLRFVLSLTYLVWFRPLIAHNLVLIACLGRIYEDVRHLLDFVPRSSMHSAH